MHDPMVVAFTVRRPWPRRGPVTGKARWRWSPPFATVAGRGLYWPSLLTVWHHEPGGRDFGEVCGYPHGLQLLRHVRHLSVQVHPAQALRRRLLTRCGWCGGPSRKGAYINLSAPGANAELPGAPWWWGEQGLMHRDCASAADAYRHCVCQEPELSRTWSFPWSWCARCGGSRMHDCPETTLHAYRTLRAGCGRNERPNPYVMHTVRAIWKANRELAGADL